MKAYLREDAKFAVKTLLPDSAEGDLASLCTWPDVIKRQRSYRWSSALHFADTPDYKCNYEYCSKLWSFSKCCYLFVTELD